MRDGRIRKKREGKKGETDIERYQHIKRERENGRNRERYQGPSSFYGAATLTLKFCYESMSIG